MAACGLTCCRSHAVMVLWRELSSVDCSSFRSICPASVYQCMSQFVIQLKIFLQKFFWGGEKGLAGAKYADG